MNADGALDLPTLTRVLVGMCDAMVASIDDFAHADQAIGDGDHGLAIGRGFHAAKEAISTHPRIDVGDLLDAMGVAMLTSMGGASGAIYGTLFRRGGRGLHGLQRFDSSSAGSGRC